MVGKGVDYTRFEFFLEGRRLGQCSLAIVMLTDTYRFRVPTVFFGLEDKIPFSGSLRSVRIHCMDVSIDR